MTYRCVIADTSVVFTVPPTVAFDYLTDPDNRAEWQSSLRTINGLVRVGDHPGDVGTAWTDVTVVPGVNPRMEVVEYVAGQRWTELGRWGPVDARLSLSFTATPAGTRVGVLAHLTVPTLLAPVPVVVRPIASVALRGDLANAARYLNGTN